MSGSYEQKFNEHQPHPPLIPVHIDPEQADHQSLMPPADPPVVEDSNTGLEWLSVMMISLCSAIPPHSYRYEDIINGANFSSVNMISYQSHQSCNEFVTNVS